MSGPVPFARERATLLLTGIVVALLAAAPLLGAGVYAIVIMTSMLAYALLAMAINLMAGHTGLLTLAHGAYAGVGAYAAVLVSREVTENGVVQLAAAVLAGAGVAAVTGWIAVRASKMYFLMLSLAIGELLHILALQWRSVTKGSDGLSAGAPFELTTGAPVVLAGYVYWTALLVFCVFAGLVLLVVRSPFGSALRGIRDNEARMRGLGYPTSHYKYGAWVFSGAVAGAAGWILVAQLPRFIAPSQLSFHLAGLLLLAVVIGGLGSMWGSCVGATLVVLMTNVISQDLGGRGPLLLGVAFVIAVYLLPRGLAGIWKPAYNVPSVPPATTMATPATTGDQMAADREEGAPVSEPALVLDGISRRFGSVIAVEGVSFSVARGARHAVIGPNGAGKSTLFALVAGTLRPTAGHVRLLGEDVTKLTDHKRARRGIAKTFQHSSVFGSITLLENAVLGAERRHGRPARVVGRHSHPAVKAAQAALDRVGLLDRSHVRAVLLSHGERRQLEVALALAVDPTVLLFDEPTAGMSAAETARFVEVVKGLPRDITVLIIEHDLDVVFTLADRVTVLHLGRVFADGTPEEIRASDIVQQTYLGASTHDTPANAETVEVRQP